MARADEGVWLEKADGTVAAVGEVTFRLTDDVLGYTRRDGRRACDKGEYRFWIASDSNVDGEEGVVYEH